MMDFPAIHFTETAKQCQDQTEPYRDEDGLSSSSLVFVTCQNCLKILDEMKVKSV